VGTNGECVADAAIATVGGRRARGNAEILFSPRASRRRRESSLPANARMSFPDLLLRVSHIRARRRARCRSRSDPSRRPSPRRRVARLRARRVPRARRPRAPTRVPPRARPTGFVLGETATVVVVPTWMDGASSRPPRPRTTPPRPARLLPR
jgi:hypothetical protein